MNILVAVDANAEADLKEARDMAALALERFVAARQRIAELEAVIDLRRGMGADVRPLAVALSVSTVSQRAAGGGDR